GNKFVIFAGQGGLADFAVLQMREGVLLDDVDVPSGDSAAGIDIIAEVGACDRLKGLCLAQVGVTAGHDSTGIDIAKQYPHRDGNVNNVCAVAHSREIYRHGLRVRHAGAVHSYVITGDAGGGGASS